MSHELSQPSAEDPDKKENNADLVARGHQESLNNEQERKMLEKYEKSRELRRFQLPEIYETEEKYGDKNIHAVLYNGSDLLAELKRQRGEMTDGGKTALSTSIAQSLGLRRPTLFADSDERRALLQRRMMDANPDYLISNDNIEITTYTDNKDRLAEDMMAYFSDKLVRLASQGAYKKDGRTPWIPNISEEMKLVITENLKKIESDVEEENDPPFEEMYRGAGDRIMDFEFSVYAGLSHSVRFLPTWDSVEADIPMYSFVDKMGYPHAKTMFFCHFADGKDYLNEHCDIETLLEIHEFLKNRDHQPVLRLTQNPANYFDVPDKLHYSFVV